MMMTVQVRFFASLREALGPQERLDVAAGATLGDVRDQLIARSPRHAEVLGRSRTLRGAINQVMCDESTVVPHGAEVAFFPPVTGG
jgi:molybdopterin synthase sulfur carrier subunit